MMKKNELRENSQSPIILQINVVVNSGSTGKIAEEIGQLVKKKGWRSIIAYGRWACTSKSELIRIGSDIDIKEHAIESRLFDNHGLASRMATKRFIRKIEELNPDVIHIHNIHGYYINYRLLFDFLSKKMIPIVWTLHDCWPMTGHCSHFDYEGCHRWLTGCHASCPKKKHYPKSILFDKSFRNWHSKRKAFTSVDNMTLVPVSYWLGDIVKKSYMGGYPIHVIYNGVNLNVFHPYPEDFLLKDKYGIRNKKVLLGVATHWGERKGLKDFYRLSYALSDDEVIVMIGLNALQIKELPSGIVGIEHTENQEELARWYSAADVILNMSYEETFGMVTVEGMACGTPVITYNKTASPELVTPETGFVVEAGNIPEIIDAINVIKQKGKSSFTNACLDRVKTEFDKNKQYQEYINLYNRLIK